MIKTLLNADEEPPEGTKVIIEDAVINEAPAATESEIATENGASPTETRPVFEIPEDAQFFVKPPPPAEEKAQFEEFSAAFADIENREAEIIPPPETTAEVVPAPEILRQSAQENEYDELLAAIEKEEPEIFESAGGAAAQNAAFASQTSDEEEKKYAPSAGTLFQSDYTPPSTAQTIRNSGLAWSAGIVLFGSVIFMMIFGWFADLLFGSSPWGLLGGIIIGGLIGIVQLFRISSQIYRK